jgi:uncharacterized BrkB/YihY/UPF0761 family membrane protein
LPDIIDGISTVEPFDFIVGIGYLIIEKINIPIALQIPITGILVFILSWGIVALIYKFMPRYAKWIMG